MKKRTTTLDVLRFAWVLWRSPHRTKMRIGELLENAAAFNLRYGRLFYMENTQLCWLVKHFWW